MHGFSPVPRGRVRHPPVHMVVGEALAARSVHIIRDAGHVARHPQEIGVHFGDGKGSATRLSLIHD